jgi:hypothetical protein
MLSFSGPDLDGPEAGVRTLLDILQSLPTMLKDAVLLSSCERSAIAFSTDSGPFLLGSQDPIRLALSLIPLTP